MSNVIEVYPQDGAWYWRKGDDASEAFDARAEAFEDALVERTTEAVHLLREDGSFYGELYHAASEDDGDQGEPSHVDILAAQTRDNAS